MNIREKLLAIQMNLYAPKDLHNKFGGYNYRSCEGILEALKPLLADNDVALRISDELVYIGDRYYIKATVCLVDNENGEYVTVNGFAREEENKKGMDASQITGAASSYARKYALNGLFLIDDNKDSDFTNTHGKEESRVAPMPVKPVPEKQVPASAPIPEAKAEPDVSQVLLEEKTVNAIIAAFDAVGVEVWDIEKFLDGRDSSKWTLADKARLFKCYDGISSDSVNYSTKDFLEGKMPE